MGEYISMWVHTHITKQIQKKMAPLHRGMDVLHILGILPPAKMAADNPWPLLPSTEQCCLEAHDYLDVNHAALPALKAVSPTAVTHVAGLGELWACTNTCKVWIQGALLPRGDVTPRFVFTC